jgi:hypothetical protein
MRYVELQSMLDQSFQPGFHHYWKSSFLRRLNDEAIEVLVRHGPPSPRR